MVDQHPEPNMQSKMVTSDKTIVYYSELLKHNFREINNTVFYIQGVQLKSGPSTKP
jgi:hypothetical protein